MLIHMQKESLIDFIRERMKDKNLSAYDVARNAKNKISPTTVTKILNGEVKASSVTTLGHIAEGLGVDTDEIFRAASGRVTRPSWMEMYAERLDGGELDESEWAIMEDYFRAHVEKWKELKAEHKKFIAGMDAWAANEDKKMLAPVVARIEPGKKADRATAQRMIDAAEIIEIEKRVTPRKKKA